MVAPMASRLSSPLYLTSSSTETVLVHLCVFRTWQGTWHIAGVQSLLRKLWENHVLSLVPRMLGCLREVWTRS